jgi:hypothetical protein
VDDFQGIEYRQFPDFETCFGVNVEVYVLNAEGHVGSVYKSRGRCEDTKYLHLYQGHFSYIKDFSVFAKKFCDKLWDHHGILIRHEKVCQDKTKHVYPDEFYQPSKTIFEELSYFGIDAWDQVSPWFIVYDFEALFHKVEGQRSEKVECTHEHMSISVSICNTVPGFDSPRCIVNENGDQLVKEIIAYMRSIAEVAKGLAKRRWAQELDE